MSCNTDNSSDQVLSMTSSKAGEVDSKLWFW